MSIPITRIDTDYRDVHVHQTLQWGEARVQYYQLNCFSMQFNIASMTSSYSKKGVD